METENKEMRKLYRSRADRYIGGVSGGLGDYFSVDSNLFRILFVVFTFIGGIGLILYLAALIIVPENPSQEVQQPRTDMDRTRFWAILLIVVGVALLFHKFGFFDIVNFWHLPWSTIWALILIAIGILLIFSTNKSQSEEDDTAAVNLPDINKIYRSKEDRMLAGVCAGIGEYFNIDPSIIRILWVLATLASIGLGILVYVILIFVFPEKPEKQETS